MSFDNWWAPDFTFFDAMSVGFPALILIAEKLRLTQYGSGQSTTGWKVRRLIIPRENLTTYTMKRELYTKNENSSHKNDDFCIKIPKTPPK